MGRDSPSLRVTIAFFQRGSRPGLAPGDFLAAHLHGAHRGHRGPRTGSPGRALISCLFASDGPEGVFLPRLVRGGALLGDQRPHDGLRGRASLHSPFFLAAGLLRRWLAPLASVTFSAFASFARGFLLRGLLRLVDVLTWPASASSAWALEPWSRRGVPAQALLPPPPRRPTEHVIGEASGGHLPRWAGFGLR